MSWIPLTSIDQLDALANASQRRPQLIFKHSTRCSVSDMAWSRLRSAETALAHLADLHFLDLIAFRDVSAAVAERFQVRHESPQTLLIFAGECVLDQSHMGVRADELRETLQSLTPALP